MSKVRWFKVDECLPVGNYNEGILCLTLPTPKCAVYGNYIDKDGKKCLGFHDFDIKLREYKVDKWCLFPYPDNK